MNAEGIVFLAKTRPVATRATDGTFQLTLLAMDRIGPHQVEAWRITWAGDQALAFWEAYRHTLTPGQPIRVAATCVRSHQQRHCAAEIHARASSIELAPRSHECAAPTNQPRAEVA